MRRRKRPDYKEFEYLYYEIKQPVNKIAKRYKVTTQTIYNWANYYKKINKPSKLSVKQIFHRYHDK